ncbi:hypothetical protein RN22_09900 [Grimontia sp. AD028]|uniref:hypothetical protein n=1 Tax=Grimontia sp. AD028 TaxID=1581149 RepID=UPI00061AF801|nr:hypothetical protein [Grimontia sp. AD028]KKD60608.1 hypothetical protein RN22_09900 [Grimontia sp. AD028]
MKSTVGLVMMLVAMGAFFISAFWADSVLMGISIVLFLIGLIFYFVYNRSVDVDDCDASIHIETLTERAELHVEDEWKKRDKMKGSDAFSAPDDPQH